MTTPASEETVTVAAEGITVEKSFEPDDFPVPAIAFAVQSDREETISLQLVDTVPDDISPENVGFHPKYGAEFWDVDGESIVFEREFDPNEEYTTVYGLRGGDADVPEKFLSEPRLESVDPPRSESERKEGALVPDEATSDDSPTDDRDIDDTEIDSETITGSQTADERDPEGERAEIPDIERPALSDGDRLLDILSEEIRKADDDDPEITALRKELGIDLTRATVEARIQHLQSAVADIEAYTDALERFLDEEGDAQQILEDVRADYEASMERLDDVEATAEETGESARTLDDRLDSELDDLRSEFSELESELESFSTELSDVIEMRDRLADALGGFAIDETGSEAGPDVADGTQDDSEESSDGDENPDGEHIDDEPDDGENAEDDPSDEEHVDPARAATDENDEE